MNVLLISQCNKRALTETRRILDQFAERRGDRTWQTPITQEGLDTLRRLLKKTARKNTAVACHWIRGKDHSELMWIVGDASQFNVEGATPTNTTRRNVLRREDENDWHTGEDIRLLASLAALLHDLGKASIEFQGRLRNRVWKPTCIATNGYRCGCFSPLSAMTTTKPGSDVLRRRHLRTTSTGRLRAATFAMA